MTSNKRSLEQILSKKARKPTPTSKNAKPKKATVEATRISLRPRKEKNYSFKNQLGEEEDDFDPEKFDDDGDDDDFYLEKSLRKKKVKKESNSSAPKRMLVKDEFEDIYEDETATNQGEIEEALDKIPKNRKQLVTLSQTVEERLKFYKKLFIQEQHEMESEYFPP